MILAEPSGRKSNGREQTETHGPGHHSYRLKPAVVVLIALVVGETRLISASWHGFSRGSTPAVGLTGLKEDATKSSSADKGSGKLVLEKDVLDIVPLAELNVKIVSGTAESVEPQKDSGLMATLEGNSVKISASKDAKAGPHQVTVRDGRGKQATINVSVKPAQ